MDYSLLIGVVSNEEEIASKERSKSPLKPKSKWEQGITNVDQELFVVGIIDISQYYTKTKRFIHWIKSIRYHKVNYHL